MGRNANSVNFFNCSLSANRDLKLHLPNSQSENALKQLKTLTSPLTKFAANIGASLDPRKYGSKVNKHPLLFISRFYCRKSRKFFLHTEINRNENNALYFQTSVTSLAGETPPELEKDKLQEKWENAKCKTKLIAL